MTRTAPETLNVTNLSVQDGKVPTGTTIYYTGQPFKVPGVKDDQIPEVGKTETIINVGK